MQTPWITLPHTWTLQDTQAGLNVLIAFLCAGCIFVLVRYFWVAAARKVAANKDVPVYSLLSLNTIGETLDVIWLLRKELLTGQYLGLLVQCVCVLLLTICTLSAGFIARFSARSTTILIERNIPGTLAQRTVASTYFSSKETDIAIKALQQAGFPHDELLDFWPDPSSQWRFAPRQWTNHSWSMSCVYKPARSLTQNLEAIESNCEDDFSVQLPFLNNIWDDQATDYPMRYGINIWRDEPTMTRHGIIFGFGEQMLNSSWNETLQLFTNLNFRTSMLFLDGPIREVNYTAPGKCMYEVGALNRAVYTTAECNLNRNTNFDEKRSKADIDNWGAFPEIDHSRVLDVMLEYYGNRWYRELWSSSPVTTIYGPDLVTFYQAYSIVRDTRGFLYDNSTHDGTISARMLDIPVRAPQVSLPCIVVCSFGALLVLAGMLNYLIFMITHRKRLDRTPQSKLDWMMQTLQHHDHHGGIGAASRHRFKAPIGLGIGHHGHRQPELVELNKGDDYEPGIGESWNRPITSVRSVE